MVNRAERLAAAELGPEWRHRLKLPVPGLAFSRSLNLEPATNHPYRLTKDRRRSSTCECQIPPKPLP